MTAQQKQQTQERLIPLLAVVGPTAVGKTKIAISLAQKLNGDLNSANMDLAISMRVRFFLSATPFC